MATYSEDKTNGLISITKEGDLIKENKQQVIQNSVTSAEIQDEIDILNITKSKIQSEIDYLTAKKVDVEALES